MPKVRNAGLRTRPDPPAAGQGQSTLTVRTGAVYTVRMKNVTLSADDRLLERARDLARRRSTTLNQMFRDWLGELTASRTRKDRYEDLMRRLAHARSGGPFSRDEMNAR